MEKSSTADLESIRNSPYGQLFSEQLIAADTIPESDPKKTSELLEDFGFLPSNRRFDVVSIHPMFPKQPITSGTVPEDDPEKTSELLEEFCHMSMKMVKDSPCNEEVD